MTLLLALLIGIVAGLRSMTAPAAVALAARRGMLPLAGTSLAFLGSAWTPWLLLVLAIGELVGDKLPMTPSRTQPPGFGFRIVTGAVSGAAIGAAAGLLPLGAVSGGIGAVVGTIGGSAARRRLASAFGHDFPAAILEDIVAIAAAAGVVALA